MMKNQLAGLMKQAQQMQDKLQKQMAEMRVEQVAAKVVPSVVKLETELGRQSEEGSGIILSADGLILTNAHVVAGATMSPAVLVHGLGPLLAWRKSTVSNLRESFLWPGVGAAITTAVSLDA